MEGNPLDKSVCLLVKWGNSSLRPPRPTQGFAGPAKQQRFSSYPKAFNRFDSNFLQINELSMMVTGGWPSGYRG